MSIPVVILGSTIMWPTQGDINYSAGTTAFAELTSSALAPTSGLYNTTTGHVGNLALDNSDNLTINGLPVGMPETYQISFSYGDATPELIATLPAASTIQSVTIIIFTSFDGTGATLSVGSVAGSYIDLMKTSEVFAGFKGTWNADPAIKYVSATSIYIAITPGAGATAGNGQVILTLA